MAGGRVAKVLATAVFVLGSFAHPAAAQVPRPDQVDPARGLPSFIPPGYIHQQIPGDGVEDFSTFVEANQPSQAEIAVLQPVFLRAFKQTWVNQGEQRIIIALIIATKSGDAATTAFGPLSSELPPGNRYTVTPRPSPGIAECIEARITDGSIHIAAAAVKRSSVIGLLYLLQEGRPAPDDEFRAVLLSHVEGLDRATTTPVPAPVTAAPQPAPTSDEGGLPAWFIPAAVAVLVLGFLAVLATTRRQRVPAAAPAAGLPGGAPYATDPAYVPPTVWAPSPASGIPPHAPGMAPESRDAPPMAPPAVPAPAWHPDPTARHQLRYWDGSRWTAHVSDHGQVSRDLV